MVLYVAVSLAVFGNLSVDGAMKAKNYALAEAAHPTFWAAGFAIMAFDSLWLVDKHNHHV